eukprot:1146458-Pelagomonas_calceolata.AAC.3
MQHVVKLACSEEVPEPVDVGGSGFSVAFDPLDGSSVIDCNFAVGTIIGIWPGDKLDGITGRDQLPQMGSANAVRCHILPSHSVQAAACMGVLGPRTVFVLAIKGYPGTHEFLLQDDGKFIHVKETTEIAASRILLNWRPKSLRQWRARVLCCAAWPQLQMQREGLRSIKAERAMFQASSQIATC